MPTEQQRGQCSGKRCRSYFWREFWRWRASRHLTKLMDCLERSGDDGVAIAADINALTRTMIRVMEPDRTRARSHYGFPPRT